MMRMRVLSIAALCFALLAATLTQAHAYDVNAGMENELLTGLLKESARVIKDAYGLDGKIGNKLTVIWDDDPATKPLGGNVLAAAGGHFGYPYDTVLILNADYFRTPTVFESDAGLRELRVTVLHELTHGMQFTSLPGLRWFIEEDPTTRHIGMLQFLYEGMAEYVGTGNDRILSYVRNQRKAGRSDAEIIRAILIGMDQAMVTNDRDGGYDPAVKGSMDMFYIGSYLATRWFDTKCKSNGGAGVKGLISYLESRSGSQNVLNDLLNDALGAASNGLITDRADVVNPIINQKDNSTGEFYKFVAGVMAEDPSVDAGRLGGYYASGGARQTLSQLSASLAGHERDEAPLKDYGFVSTTIFGKVFHEEQTQPGGGSAGDPEDDYVPEKGEHDKDVDKATSSTTWDESEGGDITVHIDQDFSKFTGVVSLDGVLLAQDIANVSRDFGAREGSTIVTIWERALKTRVKRSGAHYVTVGFTDGVALHQIDAKVTDAPSQNSGVQTSSGGGGCAAGAAAVLACALLAVSRRRAQQKR